MTLYPKSLIDEFSREMMSSLLGNPHSTSTASQLSTGKVDDVRLRALRFLNADPDHFDLIFVANATAGIKTVMEAFRENEAGFWYGYHKDSHTSMIGVREVARAGHRCFTSDSEVEDWLRDPRASGDAVSAFGHLGLFAYPAQSGMNGRRLPLSWPSKIRASRHVAHQKTYTLVDAAALASTSPLDLSDVSRAPDYTVVSFSKIFGFPDLGALIVRKESGEPLSSRCYFSGGTVEMVSCISEEWHVKKQHSLHEQLEDGTLPIHNIIALGCALDIHGKIFGSMARVSCHTAWLAKVLYDRISSLRHGNGSKVCRIYKEASSSYGDTCTQGPVIALNFIGITGEWVSDSEVEKLALIKNIQFRRGGLCNPGGMMTSLQLSPWELKRNFSAGHRCGREGDIMGGKPTGAIRLSLGAMSILEDVTKYVEFVKQFFVDATDIMNHVREPSSRSDFYIEDLMVYPIKSCGGWSIPPNLRWDVGAEGLAWDREWCLVHQGTRAALNQKRYPKMALIKPSIDLKDGLLRIRYQDPTRLDVPEISVPLSSDPLQFRPANGLKSRICDETMEPLIYASETIATFFTTAIGTPCLLARYPPKYSREPRQHSKTMLPSRQSHHLPQSTPGTFPLSTSPSLTPYPLHFSNESPILTISRSSLNRLNEEIKINNGKEAAASVFRANIILAQNACLGPRSAEQPYVEDRWRYMHIGRPSGNSAQYSFEVLGGCRRCQMVCVDQSTGEKNEEPFVTLSKTRRNDGNVYFGVHTALVGVEGGGGEGRVGGGGEGGGEGRVKGMDKYEKDDISEEGNRILTRARIQIGDPVIPIYN